MGRKEKRWAHAHRKHEVAFLPKMRELTEFRDQVGQL